MFYIEKGVRQGCPLLHYCLFWQLRYSLRQNNCIRGIKLLILEDEKHVHTILQILHEFYVISGLRLNEATTEGLWIGLNKTIQLKVYDLKSQMETLPT